MANIAPTTIARYRNNLITLKSLTDPSQCASLADTRPWLTGITAVDHSTDCLALFTNGRRHRSSRGSRRVHGIESFWRIKSCNIVIPFYNDIQPVTSPFIFNQAICFITIRCVYLNLVTQRSLHTYGMERAELGFMLRWA
jgi:hypothetical protein